MHQRGPRKKLQIYTMHVSEMVRTSSSTLSPSAYLRPSPLFCHPHAPRHPPCTCCRRRRAANAATARRRGAGRATRFHPGVAVLSSAQAQGAVTDGTLYGSARRVCGGERGSSPHSWVEPELVCVYAPPEPPLLLMMRRSSLLARSALRRQSCGKGAA